MTGKQERRKVEPVPATGKSVTINDDLHKRLKMAALMQGQSMQTYAEKLIERGLPPANKGKKNG